MNDIALALNPPRQTRPRRSALPLARSPHRVWPLAALNGRCPVILDADASARGIELAYPRLGSDDALEVCPIGTPNGTATYILPAMTPALSVDDGVITFAGRCGAGFGMIIDHGDGLASHYANLQAISAIRTDLYRPRPQRVRAGDVIGYVGAPAPAAFKRLYFELWARDGSRYAPVDARSYLAGWTMLHHHDAFTPAPPAVRAQAA